MSDTSRLSRRTMLKLAAASAGGALPAAGDIVSNYPWTKWGTPGLYPAQVVAVKHSGSSSSFTYQTGPIQQMIRTGMMQLTGATNHMTAWRKFASPGDVVGIKVCPNGNPLDISSQAVLTEIISGLLLAGVDPRNIIVYERYQSLLANVAGMLPGWVQTAWASPDYTNDQTDITGYDPNHYVELPLLLSWQDPANPAHRRSYAAQFVTRRVNKIINLASLKHHNAAGLTAGLKNLSHGCTNNVNRSHDAPSGIQLSTFIPAVVSMPVIRYKAVLHIVDGIHGLYDFGPAGPADYVWANKTMYFATDVVALDRICLSVLDAERASQGLLPVANSYSYAIPGQLSQPQYIDAAAAAGLGEAREAFINLRNVVLA